MWIALHNLLFCLCNLYSKESSDKMKLLRNHFIFRLLSWRSIIRFTTHAVFYLITISTHSRGSYNRILSISDMSFFLSINWLKIFLRWIVKSCNSECSGSNLRQHSEHLGLFGGYLLFIPIYTTIITKW